MQTSPVTLKTAYQGSNKLLLGIVLAVPTFWLFAGSLVHNCCPPAEESVYLRMAAIAHSRLTTSDR